MRLEDDGCGVVSAIGVRRADTSTLSVFEAMAPGHASVLLKKSTGNASDVAATVLLTVVGPPVDNTAAATHLAVAAVIGVATSTNFDDAVTFKDAAVVASVKL